ncbi:MAG: hypothetical protein AAF701_08105 [Pseudomonadota bacterium]
MTHLFPITRRHLLTAIPMAGIMPALPALGASETGIGRGFVQWQAMKTSLDQSSHDLDDQNQDYLA